MTTPAAILVVAYVVNLALLFGINKSMFSKGAIPDWYPRIPEFFRDYVGMAYFASWAFAFLPVGALAVWVVSRIPWLGSLPGWIQIVSPPMIVLVLLVECRGFIAQMTALARLAVNGILWSGSFAVLFWSHNGLAPQGWMISGSVALIFLSQSALISPWLGEKGRELGFWASVRKFWRTRVYGDGGIFLLPKPDDGLKPFGAARTADRNEISKGGLL